jgi:hypothetical protein
MLQSDDSCLAVSNERAVEAEQMADDVDVVTSESAMFVSAATHHRDPPLNTAHADALPGKEDQPLSMISACTASSIRKMHVGGIFSRHRRTAVASTRDARIPQQPGMRIRRSGGGTTTSCRKVSREEEGREGRRSVSRRGGRRTCDQPFGMKRDPPMWATAPVERRAATSPWHHRETIAAAGRHAEIRHRSHPNNPFRDIKTRQVRRG